MAPDARPIRDSRLRGHAPADPSRPRHSLLRAVPGPLPNCPGTGRRPDRGRDPHLVRARLQPPRGESATSGDRRGREGLAGTFPTDPAELKKLPGIGAYTAGAIAAFAHERDVAFLDTNMRRVVSRVIFGSESAPEAEVLEAAARIGASRSGLDLESSVDRVRRAAVHGPPTSLHRLPSARRMRGISNNAIHASAQKIPGEEDIGAI